MRSPKPELIIQEKKPEPKFGFVIVCHDSNVKKLKDTLKSLRIYYQDYLCVISCPKSFSKEQIKDIKEIDIRNNVIAKGESLVSLINAGILDAVPDWNMIFVAGSKIKTKIDKKYTLFTKGERDIFYCIPSRNSEKDYIKKVWFHEAPFSGTMIHKTAFKELGEFPDIHKDMSWNKLIYEGEGSEKKYVFKGLVNVPITCTV